MIYHDISTHDIRYSIYISTIASYNSDAPLEAWTENASMSLKVQWSTNTQGGNAVPSGELTFCHGKIHHFIAGKIHYFDWAIFHCYVSSPEGRFHGKLWKKHMSFLRGLET